MKEVVPSAASAGTANAHRPAAEDVAGTQEKNAMEELKAPPRRGIVLQVLGLLECVRLVRHLPELRRQPRGNGELVLVMPGFGTGDDLTALLRFYLRHLGYRARGWDLGRNDGNVTDLLPRILNRLTGEHVRTGRPVALVGWSLGGYLAREAAREKPGSVSQVITLGSTVIGGPKYTTAGRTYQERGYDLDAMEAAVEARNRIPLTVPVTAIYSKSDGIVAWQACIDSGSALVEHVEVKTTHLGLGFSPTVYRIIAQCLASQHRGKQT